MIRSCTGEIRCSYSVEDHYHPNSLAKTFLAEQSARRFAEDLKGRCPFPVKRFHCYLSKNVVARRCYLRPSLLEIICSFPPIEGKAT